MNSERVERWWWPRNRFARLAIVISAMTVTHHAWTYLSAHHRQEIPLATACRYFQRCKVCVNKAGRPVCGEASYVDEDLALRVAWFRACDEAMPHSDVSAELASLDLTVDGPFDPCAASDEFANALWITLDGTGHGFFTGTEAERRFAGWDRKNIERIAADPDGYVRKMTEDLPKRQERIQRVTGARLALLDAERKTHEAMWRACIKALPRYSATCKSASDARHTEPAGAAERALSAGVPAEVLSFGR